MKRGEYFLFFLIAAIKINSALSQPQTGVPEAFGLAGKSVTSLGFWNSLYAGTDGEGVFRRSLASPDSQWVPLGLEGRRIRTIYPHKYGPLGFAVSAGIETRPGQEDSALIYCSVFDQPVWTPMDSGIDRSRVFWIKSLDGFPDPTICGETFAAGMGKIFRRGFGSTKWEQVLDIGVGLANVVRANHFSGHMWAGGETGIFAPWIAKSTDQGATWEIFYPDLQGDNACNSIAIHPDESNLVYAGMEGAVIKTNDGGQTWKLTGLRNTPAYIYGLVLDPFNSDHIYAGATIADPNRWALWESFNAGETWREIPPPVTVPTVIITGISSLVADPFEAGVVYIATSGHGVWRYRSPGTAVDDREGEVPHGFVLEQNYPNPFNPETVIRYQISKAQDVKLEVYNLQGRLVKTLVNRVQPAGEHTARWDGRNDEGMISPSGIYFFRLSLSAATVATRKMILVR